jgi:glycine/D-amino acid oxidase-like deaminating enzyme
LTTLAIIGSGILGRSLIYTLAKEQKHFEKIVLFYSDKFAFPCTLNSTAIVAPRGVTAGHSKLGDEILEGFRVFSDHVKLDAPEGVEVITQYSGATSKLEAFKQRYPAGKMMKGFLNTETYVASEEAYLIDPKTYGDWLLKEALFMNKDHIDVIDDFVIEVHENERLHLKTQNGLNLSFDKIVFAAGNYNRYWNPSKSSKPVQGSYFEFNNVNWDMDSFSLTLDGDNLIWNKKLERVLIGSTTLETNHVLHPEKELEDVYERLSQKVNLHLPQMGMGEVKVGLREKAQKREPYIVQEGHKIFAGGLYKNGFTLSLKMSRSLSQDLGLNGRF